MMRWTLTLGFVCGLVFQLHAQVDAPPAASWTVSGQILAASDARPLTRVLIAVAFENGDLAATTVTDIDGRFQLDLPDNPRPTRYRLTALKAGFQVATLTWSRGEVLQVRLAESASLSGRVVDEGGEPVSEAAVVVMRDQDSVLASTTTDDRGEYRVPVPPNQPVFLAVNGRYYPGGDVIAGALPFTVASGEHRSSIDVVAPAMPAQPELEGTAASREAAWMAARGLTPEQATGVVGGRVIGPAGNLVNAPVMLTNEAAGTSRSGRTDVAGRFEFRQVPAGWFRVSVQKPGYAPAAVRLSVNTRDPRSADTVVQMTPLASIAGHVLTEFGDPVEGASIQVLAMHYVRGRREPAFAGSVDVLTDERGEYRVHGLQPGLYAVSAELPGSVTAGLGYRRTYFGSGGPANEGLVTLNRGQAVEAIDISLARWPVHRVTGRVVSTTGQSIGGTVMLVPSRTARAGSIRSASTLIEPDGGFEFTNVPEGDYVVQVYGAPGPRRDEFGAMRVAVRDSDVAGVVLPTESGSRISGVVILDAPSVNPISIGRFAVTAIPADIELAASSWPTALADADGQFALSGVTGLRRLVPTRLPDGWAVKTVRVGGADVGDRPLPFGRDDQSLTDVEVVLTNQRSELTGRVVDASGRGQAAVSIAVFPPNRDQWYPFSPYVKRVQTRPNGDFVVTGLPPGGYYVAMLMPDTEGDEASWQDPVALEAVASGAAFATVSEGQRTSIQLRR